MTGKVDTSPSNSEQWMGSLGREVKYLDDLICSTKAVYFWYLASEHSNTDDRGFSTKIKASENRRTWRKSKEQLLIFYQSVIKFKFRAKVWSLAMLISNLCGRDIWLLFQLFFLLFFLTRWRWWSRAKCWRTWYLPITQDRNWFQSSTSSPQSWDMSPLARAKKSSSDSTF